MKLIVSDGLRSPQEIEATQVIVRSSHGDVLAVLLEPVPGNYMVLRADDPDFRQTLSALGLTPPTVMQFKNSGVTPLSLPS